MTVAASKKSSARSNNTTESDLVANAKPNTRVTRSKSRSSEELEKSTNKKPAGYSQPTHSASQKARLPKASKTEVNKLPPVSEKRGRSVLPKSNSIGTSVKRPRSVTNSSAKSRVLGAKNSSYPPGISPSNKLVNSQPNKKKSKQQAIVTPQSTLKEALPSSPKAKPDPECTPYVSSTSVIINNSTTELKESSDATKSTTTTELREASDATKSTTTTAVTVTVTPSPDTKKLGYLQFLSPEEAALYTKYDQASEAERLAMVESGEVDKEDVEDALALEHIFDHLPVPYKDFTPVTPANGAVLYLEPHHRELFLREKSSRLPRNYLDHQSFDFDTRIRLVELIASTLTSSTWRRETFLLAVNLLDSVLKKYEVSRKSLPLYALGCVQIAVKLNEKYLMTLEDLTRYSSERISKNKIESSELNLLNHLDFELSIVQPHQFLVRLNQLDNFNKPLLTMAQYLLEVALFDIDLVTELPSKVAAACYALARGISNNWVWCPARHYYSGYAHSDLLPLIETLKQVLSSLTSDNFMFKYYNQEKRHFVADRVHSCLCRNYYPSYTEDELNSFYFRAQ